MNKTPALTPVKCKQGHLQEKLISICKLLSGSKKNGQALYIGLQELPKGRIQELNKIYHTASILVEMNYKTLPDELRQLADLLEKKEEKITESLPTLINDPILSIIQPGQPDDGILLSQGEIISILNKVGYKVTKPRILSQKLKKMGFPYANAEYYKPQGKVKRGFWCSHNLKTSQSIILDSNLKL